MSQASSPALRLTILEHVLHSPQSLHRSPGSVACGEIHWDWCLEMPAEVVTLSAEHRLWTWASDPVSELPSIQTGTTPDPIPCCRLPDHRTHYLDYEGEISGQRGQVRALARRRFEIIESVGVKSSEVQTQGFLLRVSLINDLADGAIHSILSGFTELIVRDATQSGITHENHGNEFWEILLR